MKIYSLIAFLFLFHVVPNEEPVDRIGIKGPLKFKDTEFYLAWSAKPNNNYYVQEYLPTGEKLESFNQMLTINLLVTQATVKDAVLQKEKELEKRKSTDPVCNYRTIEGPDGKEAIVDFILSDSKDDKLNVVEFNVYRYKQVDLGNEQKGIAVFCYSKRSYGEGITAFLANLKEDRIAYLNEMIANEVPKVTLQQ